MSSNIAASVMGSHLLLLFPLLAACDTPPTAQLPPASERPAQLSVGARSIDLLLVIDNSDSPVETDQYLPAFTALLKDLRHPVFGGSTCTAESPHLCHLPDIRIGIISSDIGLPGASNTSTCSSTRVDPVLRITPAQTTNCPYPTGDWFDFYDGAANLSSPEGDPVQTFIDSLQCVTWPSSGGCGITQHLEAARLALDPGIGINPGFLRPNSFLVVVAITDEDDWSVVDLSFLSDPLNDDLLGTVKCYNAALSCDSDFHAAGVKTNCTLREQYLYSVNRYKEFFAKIRPNRFLFLGIAGPLEPIEILEDHGQFILAPTCQTAMGKALPAPRIARLAQILGPRGSFNMAGINACAENMQQLGRPLADRIRLGLGTSCLPGPLLTTSGSLACAQGDLVAPDSRCQRDCLSSADCTVYDVVDQDRRLITQCSDVTDLSDSATCIQQCPCWRIVRRPVLCGATSPYAIQVLWENGPVAESGHHAHAECAITSLPWYSKALTKTLQCR